MLDRKKLAPGLSQAEFDRLVKSQLINIFRANPWLSGFYAEFFRLYSSNPQSFNNLTDRSGNFFNPILQLLNPRGHNPMSRNTSTRTCTHIKVNGIRCGSPALRSEHFCYFHQRMIRGVRTPPKSRLHPIAFLENEEAIQASLMEIVNALVRNHIDLKRAQLVLRALHIAVKNSPRVRFHSSQDEMVREIPHYPAVPAPPPKPAEPPLTAEMIASNLAAVAYLKSWEQKKAEAKAAERKAALEGLAQFTKELQEKNAASATAPPGATPDTSQRKSPHSVNPPAPARKSAESRSG
jgi:hypothetical protein